MTATAERLIQSSLTAFKHQDKIDKKRGVTFGIESAQSISCQTVSQKQNKKNKDSCLPINFFHTPGQYNKMLIQLSANQKINTFDKQIGILRSLEFINEPIFEKAKKKRQQRIKDYQQKRRQQRSIKTDSRLSKCICCCCDNFCQDCAANTLCQRQESVEQNESKLQQSSRKYLIDIEGMKNGLYKKKKSSIQIQNSSEIGRCHQRKEISKIKIEELINKTLIQTIQQKRDKQLEKFIKKQQRNALRMFNQSVRVNNRCVSAERSKSKIEVKPTKSQIRQAYWQSIKDLIAYELKRPSSNKKGESKPKQQQCHKRSPQKYDHQKAKKMQVQRGKSAERQLRRLKLEKADKIKDKMKKLLALDSKQKQIIKKCHSKKFKPSQQMIETAFAHFI